MNDREKEKQSIESLTDRYNKLHTRKIEAETNLKTARKQLDQLKKEALEKYGTDDLDALKKKLAEMETENEKKRAQYQQSLDQIESLLKQVEEKYQQS
ncbi:MAG: hypothetical protein R6T92_08405 [Desulfosalsimonadaceae bacterium]